MTEEPTDRSGNQDVDPFISLTDLAVRIRKGTVSPVDVVDSYLSRIETHDKAINAYVTVIEHQARKAAEEADRAVEADEDLGPLHGVPIALKDLRYFKEGVPHSFGSKLIGDLSYVAERTTVDVQRLEDAGAIVLGKTNVPEFGHKGATDNEYVGATATPFDLEYNAGGSSGGSAAAVAAGMASVATGSDSAGSIRVPAAMCGVFGHKPSFGLIPVDSRPTAFGLKTHHSVQGPLTRTVEDAALLMEMLVGQHPNDPSSIPDPGIDFRGAVERSVDDLRVGYSPDLDVFPVEAEIETIVSDAATALADAGATVEPVTIDHGYSMDELANMIETTLSVEFVGLAETLARSFGLDIRENPDQISESLLDLLERGDRKTINDVAATGIPRTELFDAIQGLLAEYDLLVTPTLATQGMELHTDRGTDWELGLTWPFNWTGHPAASVPAGLTDDGLPVGMQIVGRRYADDDVFAASAAVERERPWINTYPRE
ncbi:amidase [Haladaptatus halobius]|uniref:amidase n=1 Tax=Haladaptatus halobius TaxID=2884875 RepID=UPI001D09FE66|nr:amidase family protein [Haladaptatus halobius]